MVSVKRHKDLRLSGKATYWNFIDLYFTCSWIELGRFHLGRQACAVGAVGNHAASRQTIVSVVIDALFFLLEHKRWQETIKKIECDRDEGSTHRMLFELSALT